MATISPLANAPSSAGGSGSNAPTVFVYVYSVSASGQPELLGTLSPPDLTGGIALANGILAAHGMDGSGNGLVYVYSENSATPTAPQVLLSGEPTPRQHFRQLNRHLESDDPGRSPGGLRAAQ